MNKRDEDTFAAFSRRLAAIDRAITPAPAFRRASRIDRFKLASVASAVVGAVTVAVVGFAVVGGPTPPPGAGDRQSAEPSALEGIREGQAIELARGHTQLAEYVSATAGAFGDLDRHADRTGSGSRVGPARHVWAVEFAGEVTICPPPPVESHGGGDCESARPAVAVVFLDYMTGEFLMTQTVSTSD